MFKKESFTHEVHYAHGGLGDQSGLSADNAKAIVDDATVMPVPAGCLVEQCFVIIDEAITGVTNLDVGDDDNADGFVDGSLSVTLGTPGMYGYDAKLAGDYLRVQTAGATDAGDIYVVPQAKYYAAAGKEIKLDVTTASTAGKFRVVVRGHLLSA